MLFVRIAMSLKRYVLAMPILAFTTAAQGQWIFKKEENAFDEKKGSHIAITANSAGYALGARCLAAEPSLAFVTNEKGVDSKTASSMNSLSPKILFRIDQNTVLEIAADMESRDGTLVATVDNEGEATTVMSQIVNAKQRVAVALKLGDKTFHNVNFNVQGSGRTVKQVLDACKK
jgi:hypothetical protein